MEIYWYVKFGQCPKLDMDFVSSQLSLGDFKLLFNGRQYVVQHKDNTALRAATSPLSRVAIARDEGATC